MTCSCRELEKVGGNFKGYGTRRTMALYELVHTYPFPQMTSIFENAISVCFLSIRNASRKSTYTL
jgi:hypothetical protein